jgi:hypothetical protein
LVSNLSPWGPDAATNDCTKPCAVFNPYLRPVVSPDCAAFYCPFARTNTAYGYSDFSADVPAWDPNAAAHSYALCLTDHGSIGFADS